MQSINKKIPQKRAICKIIKDESAFNQLKRNIYKNIGLTKSSIDYELEMHQNKKKTLKLRYRNLQMRKDHSKITDPYEVVDDHNCLNCIECRKEKSVKEFVTYGSKCNPKLSKICKNCDDYLRKEHERQKRGEFKDEWHWTEHLVKRKTGHASAPEKCTYVDASFD